MIEIELDANFVYYVIVGTKKILEKYTNTEYTDKILMSVPIDKPLSLLCNTLKEKMNIDVNIAMSVESTQCFLLMNNVYDNMNMLIVFENNKVPTLTFPKFSLQTGDNPEKVCLSCIKSEYQITPTKEIKKSINPLTIVGMDDEILVMVSKCK